MKMVTTYNSTDLIKFANHIAQQIKDGIKKPDPSGNYRVTQGERMAWQESQNKH